MTTKRLTKATVEALKPAKGVYFVWDTGTGSTRGFGIRVLPTGRKVAILKYRLRGAGRKGTARWFTIGELGPGLTFAKAKKTAQERHADVVAGGDPARDSKARALAVIEGDPLGKERTFKALADAWAKKKASLRSFAQIERIIKTHLAELHTRDMTSLTYADLETLIDKVADRAPFMARQVFLVIRAVLELGVKKRWIAENLAAKIEVEVHAPPGGRDRVLSDEELAAVWKAADTMGWPFGRAVQLLALTAARRSEVLGLDWSEINLDASLWRLPAKRSKNGEAHVIHLSPQAVTIIKALPAVENGKIPKAGLAFTTTGKTPISGITKYKARLDEKAKVKSWRLHDLRRSAATRMSEMGFYLTVVERVLNHRGVSRSGVVGIYQRAEFLPERKAALVAWGRYVEKLVSGRVDATNVVSMSKRSQ